MFEPFSDYDDEFEESPLNRRFLSQDDYLVNSLIENDDNYYNPSDLYLDDYNDEIDEF